MNRKDYSFSLLLLFNIFALHSLIASEVKVQPLNEGWKFQQSDGVEWFEATVPGSLHNDLITAKIIEHPYYRDNEVDVQWIDKKDWVYQTTFDLQGEFSESAHAMLCFGGLDTYADVYLNGEQILSSNNMFRRWDVDVTSAIKSCDNELKIYFHSPIKIATPLWDALGYPLYAINDQSELGGADDKKLSVFTRKAGYHYGWDWGPRLVTSGVWRDIELKIWEDVRIDDTYFEQISINDDRAKLCATAEVEADRKSNATIRVVDCTSGNALVSKKMKLSAGKNTIALDFEINNPKLWWSLGLGEQHLYSFALEVAIDGKVVDSFERRVGLRTVKLISQPDEIGKSFYIELNGVPVFMKGTNYIPADMFHSPLYKEKMVATLNDAAAANMNMIRVWGGGVYEDKLFYDTCDELGLLVWQDFMFACSLYPGDEDFVENVRHEAVDNVRRLRNHPSIAMWCGNNEIEWAWYGWGIHKQMEWSQADSTQIANDYFRMFTEILPNIVESNTNLDYWASSPSYRTAGPHLNDEGDRHLWDVWKGSKSPEYYKTQVPRFMSEYGFQAYPEMATIESVTLPEDRVFESDVLKMHQKASRGDQRIKKPMYNEMGREWERELDAFVYVSQLYQAYDLKFAIETHRRNQPHCMGTLYWQINDVWPGPSWATIDYYGRWKAGHYAVRDAYKESIVSLTIDEGELSTYVITDRIGGAKGSVVVEVMTLGGESIALCNESFELASAGSAKLTELEVTSLSRPLNSIFAKAKLFIGDKLVDENIIFFVKHKDLKLASKAQISKSVEKIAEGEYRITLESDRFVCGAALTAKGGDGKFSDNYIHLIPNESVTIIWSTDDKASHKDSVEFDVTSYNEMLRRKMSWVTTK